MRQELSRRRSSPSASAISRRTMLRGTVGVGAVAAVGFPAPAVIAADRSLKIGSYGGYFEGAFIEHVYPAFTEATGISVESVTEPNSSEWLTTMSQAVPAGAVPADLSLFSKDTMIRAVTIGGVVKPFDTGLVPNLGNLAQTYVVNMADGTYGIGAMSWYTNMIINTELVDPEPASWAEFWEPRFADQLGMAANFDARLLDIAAATFFDGQATLATEDGILAVISKISELKPNVKIWWKAENVMQNAMQNEEVFAGMYYHDVTGLMAADGFPVKTVFPKEGNVVDFGSWALTATSEKAAEAHEFANFTSEPAIQALMSRMIGTAPLVPKEMTDLTDEEFAAVSSEQEPIVPAYEAYLEKADFINEHWQVMLTS